jgi:hypothetical protein
VTTRPPCSPRRSNLRHKRIAGPNPSCFPFFFFFLFSKPSIYRAVVISCFCVYSFLFAFTRAVLFNTTDHSNNFPIKLLVNFAILINPLYLLIKIFEKITPNQSICRPSNSASTSVPPPLSRPCISSVHGTTTAANSRSPSTRTPPSLARGRAPSAFRARLFKLVNDTGTT